MKLLRSSNPALNRDIFARTSVSQTQEGAMTIKGTVNKSIIMLLIVLGTASITWKQAAAGANVNVLMFVGAIGGLIVALVGIFKKEWTPVAAPIYAALEGLFLGGISAMYSHYFNGIVMQAVGLTFGTLFALLFAYKAGIIRATAKFKKGVIAATGGVFLLYMMTWLLGMFGIQMGFLHSGGIVSILISLVIVVIAALNLVLDFDTIEEGAKSNAPKYMEWYGAFSLMITLIWLYLEILRLLALLTGRD